jgi:alkyl hydroperoxide reductase subunit AhpF
MISSHLEKLSGDKGVEPPPNKPNKKKSKYDVIIIGAGPAGYTAGIY